MADYKDRFLIYVFFNIFKTQSCRKLHCSFLFFMDFFVDPKNKIRGVNQVLRLKKDQKQKNIKKLKQVKWNKCVKTQIIEKG